MSDAQPAELLIRGARLVATLDAERRELAGGWVSIRDGRILGLGDAGTAEPLARERLDASGCLVTPGLINTHHHLWQNLTRSYAPMTRSDFLGWLTALYPIWCQVDEEAIYLSTRVGLAELALGGCTTASDHLYLQPKSAPSLLEMEILAARESGLRFHATRGAVDRGQRDGSPMPDHMLEQVDDVLADAQRLIGKYHERGPLARTQLALGPHSVFGATPRLMKAAAELAERLDVRLHSHLSGDTADEAYCVGLYRRRPVEWFEDQGWVGPRTWVAHCFFPSDAEMARLGRAGVGVAHCASAGLMMGVGVAPVRELRGNGVAVGLGVDGSSNSDSGSLWLEARTALLANRARSGPAHFSARDVLEMATLDGARCLGRAGEIGVLEPGANADLCVWPLEGVRFAGAVSDAIEAWLRCGPQAPRHVLVAGKHVVREGELLQADIGEILTRHARVARRLQQCA